MDERSRSRFTVNRMTALVLLAVLACGQAGCSLFVMAGKAIFGDPMKEAPFSTATRMDLIKDEKQVVVICSTPETVKSSFPSLDYDLLEQIARSLRTHHVKIVRPDDVATFMDSHGGSSDDPQKIADNFDVDIIIQVDLKQFSYLEENSTDLFRGRAKGNISAYEVLKGSDGDKRVHPIYQSEYKTTYPEISSVSIQHMSEKTFRKRFVDQISAQIARLFYNHRASDEIDNSPL